MTLRRAASSSWSCTTIAFLVNALVLLDRLSVYKNKPTVGLSTALGGGRARSRDGPTEQERRPRGGDAEPAAWDRHPHVRRARLRGHLHRGGAARGRGQPGLALSPLREQGSPVRGRGRGGRDRRRRADPRGRGRGRRPGGRAARRVAGLDPAGG